MERPLPIQVPKPPILDRADYQKAIGNHILIIPAQKPLRIQMDII